MAISAQADQAFGSLAVQQRQELLDFPPSCKLVFYVLRRTEEPLDLQQLAEETLLPSRTIRYALTGLSDNDIVEKHQSLQDARKTKYTLRET